MNKVIVFGDLPIATKIVQYLEKMKDVEIGVVIGNERPHNNDPWKDVPLLIDYCLENNIEMYSMEGLLETYKPGELCLGLSCRFSKIIKQPVINLFDNGIINMHGGLLPEFAGLCSVNQTLIHNSKLGGGTLHYIDEGIDTGDIIRRCEFEIEDNDTAYSVFQKTQVVLEKNLEEINYNKKDLEKFRCLELKKMTEKEIELRVRAFDFPGYEPAYFLDSNGKKVYLRYHF